MGAGGAPGATSAAELHRASEGLPLFVSEMLRLGGGPGPARWKDWARCWTSGWRGCRRAHAARWRQRPCWGASCSGRAGRDRRRERGTRCDQALREALAAGIVQAAEAIVSPSRTCCCAIACTESSRLRPGPRCTGRRGPCCARGELPGGPPPDRGPERRAGRGGGRGGAGGGRDRDRPARLRGRHPDRAAGRWSCRPRRGRPAAGRAAAGAGPVAGAGGRWGERPGDGGAGGGAGLADGRAHLLARAAIVSTTPIWSPAPGTTAGPPCSSRRWRSCRRGTRSCARR